MTLAAFDTLAGVACLVCAAINARMAWRLHKARKALDTPPIDDTQPVLVGVPTDLVYVFGQAAAHPEQAPAAVAFAWQRLYGRQPDLTRPLDALAQEVQLALIATYGPEAHR